MSIRAKTNRIEKTFCVTGIQKTKKKLRTKLFGTPEICLFYTGHKKYLFIPIFYTNIECSYVHPKFLFNFFDILKFVF